MKFDKAKVTVKDTALQVWYEANAGDILLAKIWPINASKGKRKIYRIRKI